MSQRNLIAIWFFALIALPVVILGQRGKVPTLSSINPTGKTAGGAGFTLVVVGSNFFPNSTVLWNGSSRPTTFVSDTELDAAISKSDISGTGSIPISVVTPGHWGGTSNALKFTISAAPSSSALAITSNATLSAGTVGTAYNATLAATGGTSPYTWIIVSGGGSLPPGLVLSTSGVISGTPTTAGTFTFTAQVKDTSGNTAQKVLSISITSGTTSSTLAITSNATLPAGTVGVSYNTSLGATGGTPPYTWSLVSGGGSLPSGLALSASGVISGTPTSAGTFTFTIQVADSAGHTAQKVFSLVVASSTTSTNPCGSTATPPGRYQHVVIFSFENRTWSNVGLGFSASTMPYLHSLASQCTYFSDWTETNTSQSSLTQYIGETSGVDNPNTVNDCSPSSTCESTDNNIFRQVRITGGAARNYVEGATSGCSASGNAAKHIPDLYYFGTYTDATGTHNDHDFCNTEVRPYSEFDVTNLPAYAFITPTLCNDGHDCGDSTVDAWAKTNVQKVLNSAEYKSGNTAVFIWYDEDHPTPNLQIAPTAHKGDITQTGVGTHAALLKTIELMLGLPVMSQGQLLTAADLRALVGL
jgi:hypothetical protein